MVCVMVKIRSYILPDVALMDVFIETESLLSNNSVMQFIEISVLIFPKFCISHISFIQ